MPLAWKNRPASSLTPPDIEGAAARLAVSPRIASILWSRGLTGLEEMDRFLSPGLRHLPGLEEWPGLMDAARTIARELGSGKRLAVWGDYDVDGVTSTALLLDFLAARGIEAAHHLPLRKGEGYGLNPEGLERLAEQGAGILLTVDCGISDLEAVKRARELGMTVVVTDHHLPGGELPEAHAIVNPRLAPCPCEDLAGVGVAFLLAAALNKELPGAEYDVRRLLDLVALGTIADVVPLTGLNRILVKNGLLLIAEADRPGIMALKEVSSFDRKAALTAGQVAFGLAPRINAAGRVGEAQTALELLLSADLESARPRAARLDAMNTERKKIEQTILDEALAQAEEAAGAPGLVLFSPNWHPGIIGIVASRVAEAHYRPALLLTREDGLLKGSGRGIPEFDLHAALTECAAHLAGFGGHRQAAGMSLEPDRLEDFKAAFARAVTAQLGDEPPSPSLCVDGALPFRELDFRLLKELELLAPFGMGNPEPVFTARNLTVAEHRTFGGKHVKLALRDEAAGLTLAGKAWRQAENMPADLRGRKLSIAFTPRIDRYGGVPTIELTIKDWLEE